MIPYIDPIKVMMDSIISKTEIEVRTGFENESILHIEIDPEEILKKLPRLLMLLAQSKAQWDGHIVASGERPDKVVIYFDGHKYEATAEYTEITDTQFKGYKHGKD